MPTTHGLQARYCAQNTRVSQTQLTASASVTWVTNNKIPFANDSLFHQLEGVHDKPIIGVHFDVLSHRRERAGVKVTMLGYF